MDPKYTNELINESSPYLLQHAHNPVNWNGWNDAAWERARMEDKLAIVSIGYSACHWCHVMEHESFEDETVAKIMNDNFISIKVDREERPDVDQVYMDACQLITGRGGWPLNAITLPDGRPVHAGTYFPKQHWMELLLYFVNYWKNHRGEAIERAMQITAGVKSLDAIDQTPQPAFTTADREKIFAAFDTAMDYEKGGRRGAPKFPMPVNFQYLLRNHFYTGNQKALDAVTVTMDGMMNGGIYDQVGGGFARYSVDGDWQIPHFEKMLYDNGQLVSLYSETYQVTKNKRYKEVVYETLEFVQRELTDKSGGFYSALDADSEGKEGKFYVWTLDELQSIIGSDFDEFAKVFDVSEEGNFEGYNNLVRFKNAEHANIPKWRRLLLEERSKRVRPGLDDKILTSWNALMLKGCVDAYKAFGEEKFLITALSNAAFIEREMLQEDGSIRRSHKNGKSTINGFLDDYSFSCEAFIALYGVTFNEHWLQLADKLAQYVIQHFFNLNTGLFFYTSVNDAPLIARKTETSDNVIPSSNSSMMKVLFQLGHLLGKEDYITKAQQATVLLRPIIIKHPSFYANWAQLVNWLIGEPFEVAICGEEALKKRLEFERVFLPNAIFAGSKAVSNLPLLQDRHKAGETLIYVCRNKTCGLPQSRVEDAIKEMALT